MTDQGDWLERQFERDRTLWEAMERFHRERHGVPAPVPRAAGLTPRPLDERPKLIRSTGMVSRAVLVWRWLLISRNHTPPHGVY